MPRIDKPKKVTKNKRKKPISVKVAKKRVKNSKIKNPVAYFGCMKACCKKQQSISKTAHECKTNALAINKRMSAQKAQAVKKIKAGYAQLGQGLSEFIKNK